MTKKFLEIYENEILHTSFLDKETVLKCMEDSYYLGIKDVLSWMSEMNHISDNLSYIIEEYKNQKFYMKQKSTKLETRLLN
jgi:hypothetical protein